MLPELDESVPVVPLPELIVPLPVPLAPEPVSLASVVLVSVEPVFTSVAPELAVPVSVVPVLVLPVEDELSVLTCAPGLFAGVLELPLPPPHALRAKLSSNMPVG